MTLFVPHMYQLTAIAAGVKRGNLALFLDPGLGKTAIGLRILKSLQRMGRVKAALVVAPLRPCYTVWPKELRKWGFTRGMKARILHGPNKEYELSRPADMYIINPEGLKWLFTIALKGKRNWPFDMLIVDESGKFKNPASRRLQLLKPRLAKFTHRFVFNGTPAPNSLMDLWSQFLIVDRGQKFGARITHFRNQYFRKAGFKGKQWEIAGEKQRNNIYRRASDMCLVMEAEDYLDMPALTFHTITVQLPAKAMKHYTEAENDLFTKIDEDAVELKNSAVATMACRQIANGALYHATEEGQKPLPQARRPWYALHDAKLEALIDLADELQGKPLLIAYDFYHDLVRIKAALQKEFGVKNVPHIGSGVTPAEGARLEAAWNKGQLRFLLGHPGSISHGLNLQEGPGADIVWFAGTWDLEVWLQYIKRIYRQGFKGRCVRVHQIVAEGTVDEVMAARVATKDAAQQDFKRAVQRYRASKKS